MPDVAKLYVRSHDSLRTVMQCISKAALSGLPGGIALVMSEDGGLNGVVTDGDIRRGLLAGVSLDDQVERVYSRDPIVFNSRITYREILDEIPRRIKEKGRYRGGVLEKVILVDDEGRVEKVLDFLELWRNQMALHRHVAVVGLACGGWTLALVLAEAGFQVSGVRVDESGLESHTNENSLSGEEALLEHHLGKKLVLGEESPPAAEIYFLSLETSIGPDYKPRVKDLAQGVERIGRVLSYGDLVVVRSTCPVGSCRSLVLPALEAASGLRCGRDFHLAIAPDRVAEGKTLSELRSVPQIVGGFDQNSVDMAASLFREITPLIIAVGSLEAAEMTPLVNGSFRDVKFDFVNELSKICERYNLDTTEIILATNEGYPHDPLPVLSSVVSGDRSRKDSYIFADAARAAGVARRFSPTGTHGQRGDTEDLDKEETAALEAPR